ncbi:MAG: hypothetical protein P1U30_06495 [Phycisphaerales bacterium]|jgi:hypothetical protein|nr:hypothetical protein [Phycisphaerales bacterium]
MAARTGASVGVAVTITVLGAFALGFFVTTMVFYGQAQRAQGDLASANESYKQFVSPEQREHAVIRAILEEARSDGNKTVVEYLAGNRSELVGTISGDSATAMPQLRQQLTELPDSAEGSLLDLIAKKNAEIDSLTVRLEEADAQRRAAQDAAEFEANRVAAIEAEFNESAARMQGNMDEYEGRVIYTEDTLGLVDTRNTSRIEEVIAESADTVNRMQSQLDAVSRDNSLLRDQLARLRGQGKSDRLQPLNEAELVDGRIDQVITSDDEVLLSIGRKQKAVLGMTFAVYDNATEIRVNPATNQYPAGKAVIEIIEVEDDFSRARIIASSQGNPIIRGNVIANAVYDPKKTYKFVVDGLFDIDGNGVATRFETDELEALIEQWGGKLEDDVVGDIDFVVLGEKPILPPPPGPGAPIATMQEYVRLQREIQRYDDLLIRAEDASIPLLNANRLQTLIGDFPN